VSIPKQQNLPIKIHKYKKTFSKIPQKEKRFIQYLFLNLFFFAKRGLSLPVRNRVAHPLAQKRIKQPLFLFAIKGRASLFPITLRFGGGTDFYLESKATHHERDESKAYTQSV